MSKIIVIEGPDRVGKATQVDLLQKKILSKNKSVIAVEVPLRSNFIYHVIYWMLGNGLAKKMPKLFQWFQYFNRQIFQWFVLPKLESTYDYIVMDRWSLSTVIYGAATGVSESFTNKLYERLRKPDHTFILLGPSHKHTAEDVYESDSSLQEKVRHLYSAWASENHDKSIVVDCSQSRSEVSSRISNRLIESRILEF